MSKKKLFKISAACAGLLMGLGVLNSVEAGQLLKTNPSPPPTLVPFSVFPGIISSYQSAYEIYNSAATNTSPATTVIALRFDPTELPQVDPHWTVTFTFPDGDASFTTTNPHNYWILYDSATGTPYAASPQGATGSTITLTDTLINTGVISNIPSNTNLYLVQGIWNDSNANGLMDSGEITAVTNPTVVLRNKTATCTDHPVWPLSASIAGSNGNIRFDVVSFTYVTPQFSIVGPQRDSLDAELNGDRDFATFVPWSGPNVISSTEISVSNFFEITDLQTATPSNWIVWGTGLPGSISFNLNSSIAESGISSITFEGSRCTETTEDRVWACIFNSGATPLPPSSPFDLILDIDGSTLNNPTIWTISNVNITPPYCYTPPAGPVGTWWGGIEAIVPFVKYDPSAPAQTYIVFYNRRDLDVVVYARALLQDSNPLVLPTTQIATIQANSRILFTADQLQNLLPELSGYDMSQGVPIKFMFRTRVAGMTEDPYIEGIVVSIYGSEQRSVPIKFRQWRHGQYNE
ncbi:MAG: hypothetical protein ABIN23_04320 [candidate division WOR-3 bacterium]